MLMMMVVGGDAFVGQKDEKGRDSREIISSYPLTPSPCIKATLKK